MKEENKPFILVFSKLIMAKAQNFLWHKISEKEKQEIEQNAKKIMDSFADKLVSVEKNIQESFVERDECERKEKDGEECDLDFRKIMFENAPEKNKDFILGEKGGWR